LFVSTFYAIQEALGIAYQKVSLESFCDSLIREQDKLVQLGVISTAGTSNKSLVVRQKDKPKNPKKQHHRHNNKQYKGPKPTQTTSAPNGDKGAKYKNKKTYRHCNFCDKDGHDESKYFKKMATLEAAMKKHNISIDSTSFSSSHGHARSPSGFTFNTTSTSTYDEWLIDSGASYHMAMDRDMFSFLNECNTKKIFVGDDRSLSVEGSGVACEPNLAFVPSLACEPSSAFVPSSVLVSSSDDDSEDENPPPPAHLPSAESFEPELPAAPPLPRWVHSTREAASDLVGDPSDQRRTRSQFQ
jgi:hypothetical protein